MLYHCYDSPLSSAEVKNERNYNSTPPICLHGVDRDKFTFVRLSYLCLALCYVYNALKLVYPSVDLLGTGPYRSAIPEMLRNTPTHWRGSFL